MPANSQASWIDFIVRFVGEIKEAIFVCRCLYLYCEALRFLAILSIVWEKFLKSRNAVVIWQSVDGSLSCQS